MNLKNTLEIILVTYNRKKYLEHTLKQLFADNSPVKELDFTILDNASTDGTSELIDTFAQKYKNIKHIRRPRNIGGNANIASAFSIVSKKYYWIICDDDEYNFTAWKEVEEAIENNYDMIIVTPDNIVGNEVNIPRILHECTYLPSVIGKSENITEALLIENFDNIHNWFPHLAFACEIINKKKKIFITSQDIVYGIYNEIRAKGPVYKKLPDLNKQAQNRFFQPCYLNSLHLIKDKKLRAEIVDDYFRMPRVKKDFICFVEDVVNSPYNYITPLVNFTFWQKIKFIPLILFIHILYLFGFRSYIWYQVDKTPSWQMKLINIYKRLFKRK